MISKRPDTVDELIACANQLAGKTLGNIAETQGIDCPHDLTQQKGWVGQLIERALGATNTNSADADFAHLGIELKTLPLNHLHQAKESTFICTAKSPFSTKFEDSLFWKKCQRILWLPVEAESDLPLATRQIGRAILWQPNTEQTRILKQDWHELTEKLTLGHYADLSAKYGTYLQCRPKAAHSRVIRQHLNDEGDIASMIPRGFYLRTLLTNQVITLALTQKNEK